MEPAAGASVALHVHLCCTGLRDDAMDQQDIRLALPEDVLKRVKRMAAEQRSSISAIMQALLQDHLTRHEGCEKARQRQSALPARGLDLGTKGNASWRRSPLHGR